jgi:flagellar protein FliJ
MSKFIFKLEPLLRQRKRDEQERQRELAQRELVVVNLQHELKRLDESLKGASDDLRNNHLTGAIDISFLTAHRRFLLSMKRQGAGLIQQIAAAQAHVDQARLKLIEAAKQRKVMEKLREKQFARWREGQARREQADMDEIGSQIGYANVTEDLALGDA